MRERLRVLILAYACSPDKGSEPGVGWGYVSALARRHDLWVIVEEEKFRGDIESFLGRNPSVASSVRFVFLRKERNRWLRRVWPPSYYWYYRSWHRRALVLARELHEREHFDLVHQLTMVGFREPGYLWQMGVPFVWGPVGGMGLFPWQFLLQMDLKGAVYYTGYNLYNLWQMHMLRRPRLAARAAGVGLIAATRENADAALRLWGVHAHVLAEVGLPAPPREIAVIRRPGEPLRLIWSGQHILRKALPLALQALRKLPRDVSWTLHVLGHGPLTSGWRKLAGQMGLDAQVQFHGWLARDQALAVMAGGHAALITSLRDLTSTVTVEALALGLPIVCPDHCGFADAVDETCGIRVPMGRPSEMVQGFSEAIEILACDERRRLSLAEGALRRARDFGWERKAEMVDKIYLQAISQATQHKSTRL